MELESGSEILCSKRTTPSLLTSNGTATGHLVKSTETVMGPIERQMRASLSRLKSCKYPDTFDWSVYDRIASKFPTAPRGGTVFNTTFKLQSWHSACSKCHYAFEIDTYGRGCFHNCAYCYAKSELEVHGYWNRPQPFPVNLAEIRKTFFKVFETDKSSKWRSIMERRVPLRIGSMSDSFMYMDSRFGITKELLRILSFYKYPYVIFTRSDLVSRDDYVELLDKELCSVQLSISGNNHEFIRQIEPGAPSHKKRLKAVSKLASLGFWTTVRINPLFPKYPDGFFSDPEYIKTRFGSRGEVPTLPFYSDDFISEIAESDTSSVLAGFVRLSAKSVAQLSRITGVRIRDFYRPERWVSQGDETYSDSEIGMYYRWLKKECDREGLRFSTCYIGNGEKDYFQYQNLWTNKSDCCDAKTNVRGFTSSCQEIEDSVVSSFNPNLESRHRRLTSQTSRKATDESLIKA